MKFDERSIKIWSTIGQRATVGMAALELVKEINDLIIITDSLLDRPKGASVKLISYVLDRPGHDFRYAIDSSKIYNQLGWKSSDNFIDNLEKTVSWYIKQYG